MRKIFLLLALCLFCVLPADAQTRLRRGTAQVAVEKDGDIAVTPKSGRSAVITGPTSITGATTITGATAVTGAVSATGQLSTTRDPANTTNTSASLLVNPATSAANEKYIVAADNGSTVFSVDKEGDTVAVGTLAVTGVSTLTGGVTIGTGNALTKLAKYSATLTPAIVAANTCAEQTFTVTGVTASDVLFVNKPTAQAGLGIAGVRAAGADSVGINFCNTTGSGITPTAAEVYLFGAIR